MHVVVFHKSLARFAVAVTPWLVKNPLHHNMILTLMQDRLNGTAPVEPGILLWHVDDGEGGIAGVAFCTPPHPMHLSEMTEAAATAIAAMATEHQISRFVGSTSVAQRVAAAAAGRAPAIQAHQTWRYQLSAVVAPKQPVGKPKLASAGDAGLVTRFFGNFLTELGDPGAVDESIVDRQIAAGKFWLWCDEFDRPKAMAAWSAPAAGVVRIMYVYTPEHDRGKGYASALTAHVAQAALDHGHILMLFTDAANATSNKIYHAIGFVRFDDAGLWEVQHDLRRAVDAGGIDYTEGASGYTDD